MRRIRVDKLQVNDILGEAISTTNGTCLLAKGTALTSKMINRLMELGYTRVLIDDKRFEGVAIEQQEFLREETKKQAFSAISNVLDIYQNSGRVDGVRDIHNLVDSILNDVLTNNVATLDISSLQSYDQGTYTHSLSVTLLSLYLAKNLGLNKKQLHEIAVGGLLHDLGKMQIPVEILNKPGRLTKEEFDIVKKHPMDGYNAIKDKVGLLSAHIALQHHEKYDGSGYPRGLKGNEIHLYGRITAIADVYDAITADRPYRVGMSPQKAAEIMINSNGTHFDPTILPVFLRIITAYPNGTIVKLNDNSKAIVVSQNSGIPLKPNVLMFEKNGHKLKEYSHLNLSSDLDYQITEVCDA